MYNPAKSAERIVPSREIQEMLVWAREKGVRFKKIIYPAKFHPGYIGAMALEEIHPLEKMISAPISALISSKTANASELKPIFDQCPDYFKHSMLSLLTYLIWEKHKGHSSEWAPYINFQEKDPSNLQDWEISELNELQDPDLIADVYFI